MTSVTGRHRGNRGGTFFALISLFGTGLLFLGGVVIFWLRGLHSEAGLILLGPFLLQARVAFEATCLHAIVLAPVPLPLLGVAVLVVAQVADFLWQTVLRTPPAAVVLELLLGIAALDFPWRTRGLAFLAAAQHHQRQEQDRDQQSQRIVEAHS